MVEAVSPLFVSYWDTRKSVTKTVPFENLEEAIAYAAKFPGSTIQRREDYAYYDRVSGSWVKYGGFN